MATDAYCQRCRRPAPRGLVDPTVPHDDPSFDDPEFIYWEVTEDGESVICPGCLTHEEQIAMAEDVREVADEIARRQEWGEEI